MKTHEEIYRQAQDMKIELVYSFIDLSNELQGTKSQDTKDYKESLRKLILELLIALEGVEYERDAIQTNAMIGNL